MYPSVSLYGNIYTTIRVGGNATIAKYEYSDEGFKGPYSLFTGNQDMHPCVSPDENYVIFDSENRPGVEKCDFFISFKNEVGGWSEPVNMYDILKERHPSFGRITSDGKYLIYTVYQKGQFWISTACFEGLKP
jgi:hypothetical protein